MSTIILTVEIHFEHDVVLARQRARQIADLLDFAPQEQTRIATAVSEIARNAFQYAGRGKVEFLVESDAQIFLVCIRDCGPGIVNLETILEGRYRSETGMGLGIIGAKRLTDQFHIESSPGNGTTVFLGKKLPKRAPAITAQRLVQIAEELARHPPQELFGEIQQQNQELLLALEELRMRQAEVERLNQELEETNRGVVALYAELDDKAEYLQQASKLKSRFFSNMSHEFRTPLNSILSLSRLLLDRTDGELTLEQEKQMTYIRRSAAELSELVNDLLDLAKIEAGKLVVHPNEFEVVDLFSALRGMFRPLVALDSVSLIFEEPLGLPLFHTDEGKISQILRNFISNALKFTQRGEVRVSATMGFGNTVILSVADTGVGIAPEDQERIFEEFTQVENPLQSRFQGTGLGLSLSRKLAELLGGGVSVRSELGIGSTFFAIMPILYSEPAEVLDIPEINRQPDLTCSPVLVVGDDIESLFIYERCLKAGDFQAIPARTLSAARQVLQKVQPVAVVIDILLEEENGWTFLTEMKAIAATKNIPILVATVVNNQQQAITLGADAFYVKPVDETWLLDKLKTLTQQASLKKILIIDDEEIYRYVLKEFLSDTPYTIIEAVGGREGIRRAHEEHPQVIFLDLMMPDMTGFEVLEQLKSDPATRDIPVIINTGKALEEEEHRLLNGKTVEIISKENLMMSRQVAITKIREALAKARLSPDLLGGKQHV